jgi:hypothetical protein
MIRSNYNSSSVFSFVPLTREKVKCVVDFSFRKKTKAIFLQCLFANLDNLSFANFKSEEMLPENSLILQRF